MKKVSKLLSLAISTVLAVSVAGCSNRLTGSDLGDDAYNAFNSFIKTNPDKIGFHMEMSHWGLKLPEGEKFEWSKDTSANKADYAMVMLADPLINAGLDVDKLDKEQWVFKPAGKEMNEEFPNLLIKPYNVSDKKQNSNGASDAFRRMIKAAPELVRYDKDIQKFRLSLGDGIEVQWTEKLGTNDADLVFVLKAEPLVKAGLDANKLQGSGWNFSAANKDGLGDNPDQIVKVFKISK
jgi:hypothetical protein